MRVLNLAAAIGLLGTVALTTPPSAAPTETYIIQGARNADGSPRYSILQKGSGLVDAYETVYSTALGCANRGLDIARDLADEEHYAGLVRRDADGDYYLEVIEGQSILRCDSMLWGDFMLWGDALTEPMAINVWVPAGAVCAGTRRRGCPLRPRRREVRPPADTLPGLRT